MAEIYDVIVVGAGPGGATAAYFLGEAGFRVLILEKETLPRYKACGGGLSAPMLEQFPFSFEPVIESCAQTISYALGERTVVVPIPDQTMYMVMRDRFDAHILAHAQVEIRQGVAVRQAKETPQGVLVETRNGQTFEGRYLIGADGANSVVARSFGLRQGKILAAAIEAEVPVSPEVMQRFVRGPLFIFGEIPLGYLWVFPKANHLSVGIGAMRPKPGELQATLTRVMTHYAISLEGIALHGHPIPIYLRHETIATGRTLLVGDAAGLVDPFTGEGIRLAIKSGRLAAEALLAGRPDRYSRLIYRRIGINHTLGLGLALFFYRFPRICFALGMRNPFATHAFIDMFSDRGNYAQVILWLVGGLPLHLFTTGLVRVGGLFGRSIK